MDGSAPAVQDPIGESDLLRRLRRGEDSAFALVVELHGGRLLATAKRLLRDEEHARDAVQKTFLSAFQAIDEFDGQARLSTWLHRIVVNHALMKLRSERRCPEVSIDQLFPRFDERVCSMAPILLLGASTESLYGQREIRCLIRRAIDQLPERYRAVLLLRGIEEWDTEETAQALSIAANAVKVRLHRARRALRVVLERSLQGTSANGLDSTRAAGALPPLDGN